MGDCAKEAFKSCFSVCHSPEGLMELRLVDLQSQMFLRLVSHISVLKIGVPNMGYKHFAPQVEAPDF